MASAKITDCPLDVLAHVCAFLGVRYVGMLRRVCSSWREISYHAVTCQYPSAVLQKLYYANTELVNDKFEIISWLPSVGEVAADSREDYQYYLRLFCGIAFIECRIAVLEALYANVNLRPTLARDNDGIRNALKKKNAAMVSMFLKFGLVPSDQTYETLCFAAGWRADIFREVFAAVTHEPEHVCDFCKKNYKLAEFALKSGDVGMLAELRNIGIDKSLFEGQRWNLWEKVVQPDPYFRAFVAAFDIREIHPATRADMLYEFTKREYVDAICVFEELLELTAYEVANYDYAIFRLMAKHGRVGVLRRLSSRFALDSRAARAADNYSLRAAAAGGHVETVRFLVSQFHLTETDARTKNHEALQVAIQAGHVSIIELFLELGWYD